MPETQVTTTVWSAEVERLANQSWTYHFIPYLNEADTWFVQIEELPGCMTEGDGLLDAWAMIQDATRGWIETALEQGMTIPIPQSVLDDMIP